VVVPGLRWFFAIAAALAFIAGILLFVLAAGTDRFFSWTIEPPLTAAFLGAAYWAACVLLAMGRARADVGAGAARARPGVRDRRHAAGRNPDPAREVRPGQALRVVLARRCTSLFRRS
jgi:hypothetical protein